MTEPTEEILRGFIRRFPIAGRYGGSQRLCEVCRGSAPVPLDPHVPGCPLAAAVAVTGLGLGDLMEIKRTACVGCGKPIESREHRKFNGSGWLHKGCV